MNHCDNRTSQRNKKQEGKWKAEFPPGYNSFIDPLPQHHRHFRDVLADVEERGARNAERDEEEGEEVHH